MSFEPNRPAPGEGRAGGNSPQVVLASLPAGWQLVGRSRSGLGGAIGGCYVLAHASTGVALVDVAPDATPSAEGRLRRCLASTGFTARFPGLLPVAHVRVEPTGLGLVQPLLEGCFNAQPRLGITDPDWVTALAGMLEAEPAWSETAPIDFPIPPDFLREDAPRRRGSRLLRWGLGGFALAASFIAGVIAGVHTTADLAPPGPASAAAPAGPERAPLATAAPATASEQAAVAAPAVPAPATPASYAASEVRPPAGPPGPELPESRAIVAPVPGMQPQEEAASPPEAAPVARSEAARSATPTVPETEAEPSPPPTEAPRSRPVATRHHHLAIDPGCAQAVLRYQQGLSLSWTEMAHVRNGCRTVVRR